jgi:flagellar motor switch protein FliN/FliY
MDIVNSNESPFSPPPIQPTPTPPPVAPAQMPGGINNNGAVPNSPYGYPQPQMPVPEFTPPPPPNFTPPGYPPTPPQGFPQPQFFYPPPPPPPMPGNPLGSIDTSKFTKEQIRNLQLLMNVPMNVSVEIGSTTRKIDDILDFSQGTVLELDRTATSPVDIVVNGNLIAKGEVVVVDDNFAIKIVEILSANMTEMLKDSV